MTDSVASERALRKQLLLARAALERAEMLDAIGAAVRSTDVLRHQLPGLALGKLGGSLSLALQLFQRIRLIKPLLSVLPSVLPIVLATARKPLLRYALLGGTAALLAWKGWQLAARHADKAKAEPSEDGDGAPA